MIGLPLFRPLEETVVLSIINHTCGIFSESPGYKNIKYHDPRYEIQKCPKSNVLTLPHGVGVFSSSKSDHTCGIFLEGPVYKQLLATLGNFRQLLGNVNNLLAPFANFCHFLATLSTFWQLLSACGSFWQPVVTFGNF